MNYCKKCGSPAPEDHEVCWCCEHEGKLTAPKDGCSEDACPISEQDGDQRDL